MTMILLLLRLHTSISHTGTRGSFVSSALHAAKNIVFLGTLSVAGTSLELLIAASKKGDNQVFLETRNIQMKWGCLVGILSTLIRSTRLLETQGLVLFYINTINSVIVLSHTTTRIAYPGIRSW